MRLTIVARRAPPATGGMESFLGHLAPALAGRHELTIVAWRNDDGPWGRREEAGLGAVPMFEPYRIGGARVVQLRLTPFERARLAPLRVQWAPGLARLAFTRSRIPAAAMHASVVGPAIARLVGAADIVHSWGPDLLATAARSAAHQLSARFVVTPFSHPGQWGTDPATAHTLRRAARVLALSESDANTYREMGVPDDVIDVVGVCVPAPADVERQSARVSVGVVGPFVLFLGARRAYKGWDILRDAVGSICERVPDAIVGFVGPGDPLSDRPGLRDFGLVEDPMKAELLAAADLLCLPSSFEILPVSVLESWSYGVPAVVSDIAALRELATLGGAVAVPRTSSAVADAIVALLEQPATRAEMSATARRLWRERFSVEAVAAAHLDSYAKLAAT